MKPEDPRNGATAPRTDVDHRKKTFSESIVRPLVAGMIIVIPLYLVILLLLKTVQSLVGLLRPLTALLPEGLAHETILALLLLLVVCFLTGFAVRTPKGRAWRARIGGPFFQKIPGFALFQGLTEQLTGAGRETSWKPALVEIEDALVPGFIIEAIDEERLTVFVPSSPTPLAGAIYVLERARVHPVDVPLTHALKTVSQWGAGCKELVGAVRSRSAPT